MVNSEKIELDPEKILTKRYKVRRTGRNGVSLETTIPRVVFEREARRHGLSLNEAVEKLEAVWKFNSFHGLYLSFERKSDKHQGKLAERRTV